MTVSSLRKQFFFGIVTLIIVLIGLTGATYAWFVLNTSVSANGMQINATTEGISFEITNAVDSNTGKPVFANGTTQISVQYDEGQCGLIPTHPDNLQPFTGSFDGIADWYHAFSNDYDDANVTEAGTKWPDVQYDLSRGYGYYWNGDIRGSEPISEPFAMAVPFYVRLNPDTTGENVKLKDIKATNLLITDSSGTNKLRDCVYLLVSGSAGTYRITMPEVTANEPVLVDVPSESGTLIDWLTSADEYATITVFVYFDGRDKDCKSANFDASGISVSLSFTGIEVN